MDDLVERLLDDRHMAQCDGLKATLATAHEAAAEIRSLRAQVAQTAEFICRKCGRRQDGPTDNEARF